MGLLVHGFLAFEFIAMLRWIPEALPTISSRVALRVDWRSGKLMFTCCR
jgi:hypothetical protein